MRKLKKESNLPFPISKLGNPTAIQLHKEGREKRGERVAVEEYGLYKELNCRNSIRVYAKNGNYEKPIIVMEFPITTSLNTLLAEIPKIIKHYQGLKYRVVLKANKVIKYRPGLKYKTDLKDKDLIYKTYSDDRTNYDLETPLGKFYFIRNGIIRELFRYYKSKGINKTVATQKIQRDLEKLSPEWFNFKPDPGKRILVQLSLEAIRKIIQDESMKDFPDDFPQPIHGEFPFIKYRIFTFLKIPPLI